MTPAYLAEIERAFTAGTGRGLMLSPADRERVAAWARAGVPAAVVVAGIEQAFETPPARRVRGLGYAAAAIDRAIKRWRDNKVGETPAAVDPTDAIEAAFATLLDHIVRLGRAEQDPTRQAIKRRAWRAVDDVRRRWQTGDERDPIGAVIDAERALLHAEFEALDAESRAAIEDTVLDALDGFSIHDPETLRITRETLLYDALRARLDLPALELRFVGGRGG